MNYQDRRRSVREEFAARGINDRRNPSKKKGKERISIPAQDSQYTRETEPESESCEGAKDKEKQGLCLAFCCPLSVTLWSLRAD